MKSIFKNGSIIAIICMVLSLFMLPACHRDIGRQDVTVQPMFAPAPISMVAQERMPAPPPQETFNTESYDSIKETGFKSPLNAPLSTFSIDVDTASYTNIRRFLMNYTQMPPKDAVRIEEMINYFSYDYPEPNREAPLSVTADVGGCPWNASHRLARIALKGRSIEKEKMPPMNLVFLLDVSGSMNSPEKLPLLKKAFRLLSENLRKKDRVSIVVYAGAAGQVLPPTPGNKKQTILRALDKLEAGGSTAGAEGILLAYRNAKESFIPKGNNRVIIATDGDFNVGVSSDGELVRLIESKRDEGIFLTVLGFGTGNYKDSKMEKLADKGNGNYAYIDSLLEAKKVLVKEMGGTLFTIAKDVKLQVEFNPSAVKAYRLIGYENRQLEDEDFNDDKKDAGELGAGHTVTALYEIIPAGSDEAIPGVDDLKYQQNQVKTKTAPDELMTVKVRWKRPDADTSSRMVFPVQNRTKNFKNMPKDFRFAASVAGFGMLLRDSQFKGGLTYKKILETARASKGSDAEGYRAEFIRLVEQAEMLAASKEKE